MSSSLSVQRPTDNEQIIGFIQDNNQYTETEIILDEKGEIKDPWTILEEISNNLRAPILIRQRSRYLYELSNRSFW
jgi:hypothetical protein